MILLLSWTCSAETDQEALSCPEHQEGFDGSCYELVTLQRPFLTAQGWCERGGGHIAFILNDETQQFLQKHLEPDKDWWLGLAPASPNLTLDSAATEGSLAWLDGSDVSYNNWVDLPDADAACGHVLRHSGFQWAATANCSQELNFICQFDSWRSIACDGQNVTLQCGSGQVIDIDDSFYGRKTIHYCRSKLTATTTSVQEECSWIDVVDSVTARCRGLQACHAPVDLSSFGEPCPVLGSYLSVEYHCKHGLQLLMSKLAAVFENVTITVKWLLHPFQGNLTCALKAGDGHIIDPYSPEEMESTVIHSFSSPGVFTVTVQCSTSEWHVTAQRDITIQEPVGDFSDITCYGRNASENGTICSVLHGQPVDIQLTVAAGTNITYTIHHEGELVGNSSAVRGLVPHNITLSVGALEQLRRGCNNLTLAASNLVTARTVSAELQLCLLEPVDGLQASVAADDRECPDSHELVIGVSLERGAPAQLLFSLTGANDTLSDTREMVNGSQQLFTFSSPIEGSHLRCSNADVVKSVFLPLGDKNNDFRLSIVVTVKNRFQETSTTVHAQVRQSSSDASVEDLQSAMDESVTQLEQDGQLSTEALGQIFTSVSEVLNAETDEGQKDARSKLREQMLTRMNTFLLDSPTNTSQDVQTTARAVAVLTQRSDELSPTAQEEASALLLDLSSSLNTITVQDAEDDVEVVFVATPIIEAASNILTVSSNEKVSDSLLSGMNNIQSALLHQKKVNEGPIIIGSEQISVYVNRPDVEQENSTIVDLANFSTIIINVPSPDVTLVIKLEPSEDISLRLLLGYKEYPSDENYLANTQIPHADSKEEEQYTWVLGPNDREGTTGVHFLVMKPVVEPGVKSINATVNVVTIAAQCKYWNEHDSSWSENGCRVTVTLLGTEGESEPHHLTDPEKNVFERGEEDMFLLTTHFSLGELQSIRLWHDNSGAHPAW
ncbi:unnamed protein product [Lampetra planeri]